MPTLVAVGFGRDLAAADAGGLVCCIPFLSALSTVVLEAFAKVLFLTAAIGTSLLGPHMPQENVLVRNLALILSTQS